MLDPDIRPRQHRRRPDRPQQPRARSRQGARRIATLETARRRLIPELEGLKREQNTSGDEIARAKRQGLDTAHFRRRTARARSRSSSSTCSSIASSTSASRAAACCRTCRTRACRSARARRTTSRCGAHGEPRAFDFEPQPHWDLGPALGIIDFERAHADRRRAVHGAERRRRAARARAHQLHARPAHARARLPRDRAAVPGQQRVAHRHRQPAEVRSRTCSRSPATGICIWCRPPKCR